MKFLGLSKLPEGALLYRLLAHSILPPGRAQEFSSRVDSLYIAPTVRHRVAAAPRRPHTLAAHSPRFPVSLCH